MATQILAWQYSSISPTDLVCYASVFQVITKDAAQGAPISLDVSRRKNILILLIHAHSTPAKGMTD